MKLNKPMTPERMEEVIAVWHGPIIGRDFIKESEHLMLPRSCVIPSYCIDRQAIQDALQCLQDQFLRECFVENLLCVITSFDAPPDEITSGIAYLMVTSSPAILAEALVRTLGKWED